MPRSRGTTPAWLLVMTLALTLVQLGGTLPLVSAGVLLFGVLALARPDLGLLFVPLAVPLYLIPVAIEGVRADLENPFRLPLHEIVLLLVLAASVARWIWGRLIGNRRTTDAKYDTRHGSHSPLSALRSPLYALRYAPHLLFLLAGVLGVLLAVERARALRELRWLIVEPLFFYALVRLQFHEQGLAGSDKAIAQSHSQFSILNSQFAAAFVLSGAIVGLLGLLQIAGLDLVPLLGRKECFAPDGGPCANVIADGSVRRALSVYGHPNNLGLFLGRAWPIAAALAFFWLRTGNREPGTVASSKLLGSWFWVLGSVLCLGGIAISFSRGAWLGALVALAVLALGIAGERGRNAERGARRGGLRTAILGRWLVGFFVVLAVVAGLALTLRGDVTAGSTPVRLLLWREALGYLAQHPLGIGLDQFGVYHNPSSGLSLIDPALLGSSEEFAAHPHNLLLDIALRLGPLGLLAFGWLLARFFRSGMRHAAPLQRALALGATAAMAAALTHGLVDNFYFVPDLALAFWLLLALKESVESAE